MIMKLNFFGAILFFLLMGNIVAQNRDTIHFLPVKVKKIEFSERNQAYFIYAKSKQSKSKFVILSPINRNDKLSNNLKPVKQGKKHLLEIEYLDKGLLILGSSGIYNAFGKEIIVRREIIWYGEIVIAHNLYGKYYESKQQYK